MKRLVTNDLIDSLALAPAPSQTGEWPVERMASLIDAAGFRWGDLVEWDGASASSGLASSSRL